MILCLEIGYLWLLGYPHPIGDPLVNPHHPHGGATLLHQGAGWTPLRPICAGGASLNASALFFFFLLRSLFEGFFEMDQGGTQ